jgi:hypothetical protein
MSKIKNVKLSSIVDQDMTKGRYLDLDAKNLLRLDPVGTLILGRNGDWTFESIIEAEDPEALDDFLVIDGKDNNQNVVVDRVHLFIDRKKEIIVDSWMENAHPDKVNLWLNKD